MKVEWDGELLSWKTPFCTVTSSCPKLFIVHVTLKSPQRISSTLMDIFRFFFPLDVNFRLLFFSQILCATYVSHTEHWYWSWLPFHYRTRYAHSKSIVLSFSKFQGFRPSFFLFLFFSFFPFFLNIQKNQSRKTQGYWHIIGIHPRHLWLVTFTACFLDSKKLEFDRYSRIQLKGIPHV